MAAADAASSVFGAAAKTDKKAKAPRTMLKNMDTLAVQACDPYGPSVIDEATLDQIWKIVKKGNKWAAYFAECASDEDERKGIFLSRFCETMVNICTQLRDREDLRACLKEEVLAHAQDEANLLLPHLLTLNAGKASFKNKDEDSIGGLKRRKIQGKSDAKVPSPQELEESATALYNFIAKGTDSNLRMLIHFLRAGGMFWSGQCMDLSARAWVACGTPKPDAKAFHAALAVRHSAPASASSTGGKRTDKATGSLFETK
jgi:hypothetical protein